tara:strand:- start:2115 stop:3266 length:1152 start_codon:yes stop_codon:yes gene_type:complete
MRLNNVDMKKYYPLLLIIAGIMIFFILIISKPKSTPKPIEIIKPIVEVEKIYLKDMTVSVKSQGFVSPKTESQIYPEISGKIIKISNKLEDGASFKKGDILLQIDPTDYKLALKSAESNLAQAKLQLSVERAESELARKEWEKIGDGKASELTLRTPQLNRAIAVVEAAEALLQQSKRNLEKTQISAPYDGLVRKKNVDIGTVIGPGYLIASVYAIDYVEVKLPIPDRELEYIEIPLDGSRIADSKQPRVVFKGLFGGENVVWNGKIVRMEADLDMKSRMATLISRVDNPYKNKIPLKVGQYVEAEIYGKKYKNIFSVPRDFIYQQDNIIIISPDSTIEIRKINILKIENNDVLIDSGIKNGELICLTNLDVLYNGMSVNYKE